LGVLSATLVLKSHFVDAFYPNIKLKTYTKNSLKMHKIAFRLAQFVANNTVSAYSIRIITKNRYRQLTYYIDLIVY